MASECKKCGNKDNYNFALNIGLCDTCISTELAEKERLEAELKFTQQELAAAERNLKEATDGEDVQS